jgi:hypothetical protein
VESNQLSVSFLLRARSELPEPRTLVFEHALSLALDAAEETEAVAELLALSRGDRTSIESARYRFLGLLDGEPDDVDLRSAVSLLDQVVRRGTERGLWPSARSFVGTFQAAQAV